MKNVDEYIKSAPDWATPILSELRETIKKVAPDATESISYHMPYYSQNGRVAYFAYFKNHCSFFWVTDEDKKKFKKELANLKVVGSTLQIPKGDKVPKSIIEKLVKDKVVKNQLKSKMK